MKIILTVLVLVALGIGGLFLWDSAPIETEDSATPEENDTNSAMRAEENAVMVFEQRPGSTVTGTVYLAAPGYLVIHEDTSGEPGASIGASNLLRRGESRNVQVVLSRAMKDGETFHAMLHFEKSGNTSFSAIDTPVPSSLGGPISGWFEVSDDAPLEVPISL